MDLVTQSHKLVVKLTEEHHHLSSATGLAASDTMTASVLRQCRKRTALKTIKAMNHLKKTMEDVKTSLKASSY